MDRRLLFLRVQRQKYDADPYFSYLMSKYGQQQSVYSRLEAQCCGDSEITGLCFDVVIVNIVRVVGSAAVICGEQGLVAGKVLIKQVVIAQ